MTDVADKTMNVDNLKEFEKRAREAFSRGKNLVVFEGLTSDESEKLGTYLSRQGFYIRQMHHQDEKKGGDYSVRVKLG